MRLILQKYLYRDLKVACATTRMQHNIDQAETPKPKGRKKKESTTESTEEPKKRPPRRPSVVIEQLGKGANATWLFQSI